MRATGEIWERFSSVFSVELKSETDVEAEPASLQIPVDFTQDDVYIVRFGQFIFLEIQVLEIPSFSEKHYLLMMQHIIFYCTQYANAMAINHFKNKDVQSNILFPSATTSDGTWISVSLST